MRFVKGRCQSLDTMQDLYYCTSLTDSIFISEDVVTNHKQGFQGALRAASHETGPTSSIIFDLIGQICKTRSKVSNWQN